MPDPGANVRPGPVSWKGYVWFFAFQGVANTKSELAVIGVIYPVYPDARAPVGPVC
jgi:hypothetical protein